MNAQCGKFMTQPPAEAVIAQVGPARALYHRLVLVVGKSGAGKTGALREVAARTRAPLVNVNLELSRRLLDLTERQRPRHIQRLLEEVVAGTMGAGTTSNVVLLDNVELLFDVRLQQDPFRLLRDISRRRTVVAACAGSVEDGHLRYAAPGHAEYQRHATDDILVVSVEGAPR